MQRLHCPVGRDTVVKYSLAEVVLPSWELYTMYTVLKNTLSDCSEVTLPCSGCVAQWGGKEQMKK